MAWAASGGDGIVVDEAKIKFRNARCPRRVEHRARKEGSMLLALIALLVIAAFVGGIVVNPLLFLILLVAVIVLFRGGGVR